MSAPDSPSSKNAVASLLMTVSTEPARPESVSPASPPPSSAQRQQMEQTLRDSEARIRLLADAAPVLTWMTDPALNFTFYNAAYRKFTGGGSQPVSELNGAHIHPEDAAHWQQTARRAMQQHEAFQVEYRLRRHDGAYRWLLENSIARLSMDGSFLGYLGFCVDITERKQTEEALTFTNSRLELLARVTGAVLGAAPLHEQIGDIAGQITRAFEATACVVRLLEGEELVLLASAGVPLANLHPRMAAAQGIAAEIMAQRQPLIIRDVRDNPITAPYAERGPHTFGFLSYAGAPLLVDNSVVGILGIYQSERVREFTPADLEHLQIVANHIAVGIVNNRLYAEVQAQKAQIEFDMEERKRLEAQLLQSQKMEGLGRLAGGIAHDFNNLLTAIMGYTELAESETPRSSPAAPYLQTVQQAAQRAAALTQQLLAFARKQMVEPKVLSLNDLILDADRLLRRLIGADVELLTLPESGLGYVRADPNLITQILVNLAVNARDAMPDGGRLTIETANVTLDDAYARQHAQVPPGEYILLSVSDTGTGMDEATRARIFEPFFTTKEAGRGTGLGLATCYGIVQQSGGHIWVYSELGRGTAFKVYLPQVTDAPTPLVTAETPVSLPFGTETVLIAEDEPLVRALAVQTLRTQGYQVLEADNGMTALALAATYTDAIDLLVTDVVMPQMGGPQLAEALALLRPDLKTLYLSGYTENAILRQGVMDADIVFLQKPYTPGALIRKVRETLDAA